MPTERKNYFNIILFYRIICFTHFLIDVSALEIESIVGGWYANQYRFKFQVAILSRSNYSNEYLPNCGGGLIASDLVLSAAHCFITVRHRLRELSYTVSAGHVNLVSSRCIRVNVKTIYAAPYNPRYSLHDIAVLKLERELGLSPYLSVLRLPTSNVSLESYLGRVAGFGYDSVSVEVNWKTGRLMKTNGSTDLMLKYGMVKILNDTDCNNWFTQIDASKQLCVFMQPYLLQEYAGVCTGDSGSALVMNSTVVGIASRSPCDCKDSIHGAIFTKVSAYLDFIEAIIAGIPLRNTLVFLNRPYKLIDPSSSHTYGEY